jgi:hypothetical protein
MRGGSLNLGTIAGTSRPLVLPAEARERHVYVCGGTGVGKSKLLEHCIREDILNWRDHRSGLLLLDPHGLVYQNIMSWLAKHDLKRPVVPIDFRQDDWIISYNLLRQRKGPDPAAIVENFVRALAHVWGQGGTDQTPLFGRWATVLLLTLYQNGHTIADVMQLVMRDDVRRAMSLRVDHEMAKHAWQSADRNKKNFETEITSTINRFMRLLGPQVMRATLGQPDVSLDLGAALEEGQIVLVNLSTEGGLIDDEDADTIATLLLTDLWSAAKARGKAERGGVRLFHVYIDECQNFVTPTIAKNLDQARGFGLHLTLANQFPSQFLNAGLHGKAMYDSILANAGTKIVFRVEHPEDVKSLGTWLFMNTFDTDEVKLALKQTKVMGYREEMRESYTSGSSFSEGVSSGRGGGQFQGSSSGAGTGGSASFDPLDADNFFSNQTPFVTTESWNEAFAKAQGTSESWSDSESRSMTQSESVTRSSILVPVMGQELSSVQYRSTDEQLFRAMQQLFDQKDRHFVIRYHGGPRAPVFVKTPTVTDSHTHTTRLAAYRQKLLEKLPFALPMSEAMKRVGQREQKLLIDVLEMPFVDEPRTAKRRIK